VECALRDACGAIRLGGAEPEGLAHAREGYVGRKGAGSYGTLGPGWGGTPGPRSGRGTPEDPESALGLAMRSVATTRAGSVERSG
jgi:hypothetical protein